MLKRPLLATFLLTLAACSAGGGDTSPSAGASFGGVQALSGYRLVKMTATDETAFGSVAASYAEKLSKRSYLAVDVVNDTDCDIQVRLDDLTGTPDTVVTTGTAETLKAGELGGIFATAVSLQYMTGETCSSGSVYIKGLYH